jgi:hypothetical protein
MGEHRILLKWRGKRSSKAALPGEMVCVQMMMMMGKGLRVHNGRSLP